MAKKTRRKVTSMPITQARVNLGAVVRRVHLNKEYIILEKGGIPVAGLMDADELEDYLEVHDPKVRSFIRKSHEEYLAGKGRPAEQLLAELMAESSKAPANRMRKSR
jgi:antitoxin (DNA-binding transcriptional repressor) of toxin-antitoxin stability system